MQPATHSAYLHQLSSVAKAPSTLGKRKEVLIFKSLYAAIQGFFLSESTMRIYKSKRTSRCEPTITFKLILQNLSLYGQPDDLHEAEWICGRAACSRPQRSISIRDSRALSIHPYLPSCSINCSALTARSCPQRFVSSAKGSGSPSRASR